MEKWLDDYGDDDDEDDENKCIGSKDDENKCNAQTLQLLGKWLRSI